MTTRRPSPRHQERRPDVSGFLRKLWLKRASGGSIPDYIPDGDEVPVSLSEGIAVVPDAAADAFDRAAIALLNGGGVVMTASEALDDEDEPAARKATP